MSVEQIEKFETNPTDTEFKSIVEQIDGLISQEEIERLVYEPQMKASGTMDQGYRHD